MRNYTVGINVDTADELESISVKLRAFIDVIGEGKLEVQLAINPNGLSQEELPNVIGFATEGIEYEIYEEDDE